MFRKTVIIILSCVALAGAAWDFNGVDSRKVLNWRPRPGRFAVTLAFRLNVPAESIIPGKRETVFYPLVFQAVKPGKDHFQKLQLAFVTKPHDRYFFAAAYPGGRYNIAWIDNGGEIPVGKPVWVFVSAAAGAIFETRVNGRNYSHVRSVGLVPLVNSAPEYKIYLGHNPYKGGVGFLKCSIDNFMLFERVLSVEEMEMIEKSAAYGNTIPGKVEISL